MVRSILLLGNEALYRSSSSVEKNELQEIAGYVIDLRDTLLDFRNRYHVGRAIAAPQIGVFKRLIYRNLDGKETVFINPRLYFDDDEMLTLWDDCMSFPNLLVRVRRHIHCRISYLDMDWQSHEERLEGDMAELLQHEYDHLDGILATMRAIDNKSFQQIIR